MITLFASLIGFISSIIPEIIKYFKDLNDKTLEEIHVSREILEQASLYSTYKTEIRWVDMLNGTVRPVLAYSFFIMYIAVKYMQYKAITSSAHLIEYLDIIWNVDDQAIFAGIISFYYGHRTFRHFWKNREFK